MNHYNELFDNIRPVTRDITFTEEVLKRHQKRKQTGKRTMLFTICIAVVLTASTLTAGAANNWDYQELARYFFGGSTDSLVGVHEEIRFTIGENTFEGITFEVIGLYVDTNDILISIDLISEEPIFQTFNTSYSLITPFTHHEQFLLNSTTGHWETDYTKFSNLTIRDKNTLTVVYRISNLSDLIFEGAEYTMIFYGIENFTGVEKGAPNYETTIGPGKAVINFIIDKLALENLIIVHPNITLESEITVKEVSISPFKLQVLFEGNEEAPFPNAFHSAGFQFRMNDGSISILSANAAASGYDLNTNTTYMTYYSSFNNLINVKDVAAVIYRGIEIPIS